MLFHECQHGVEVANVGLDKRIVGFVLYISQVLEVAGIGQFIDTNDMIVRIFVDKQSYYMGTNESSSTSDDDVHGRFNNLKIKR